MANQVKLNRQQSTIMREISLILQRELKEPKLATISIHEVKLTNDLSYAKVYYAPLLESEDKTEVQTLLNEHYKEIRTLLAHKLTTYKCPDLIFIYDESLDNANHIESILKETKQK